MLTVCIARALGELQDDKAYKTGLEVSPMVMYSLLKGLKINSQCPDRLELVVKELCRAASCFQGGGDEFNINDLQ